MPEAPANLCIKFSRVGIASIARARPPPNHVLHPLIAILCVSAGWKNGDSVSGLANATLISKCIYTLLIIIIPRCSLTSVVVVAIYAVAFPRPMESSVTVRSCS